MNNTSTEQSSWSAFRLAGLVAIVNAVVSVGFSMSTVIREHTHTSWYGADRAAALLVAVVVVVSLGQRAGLLVVGWMLAAVQAADAVIGLASGSVTNSVGPAVLAIATGLALVRLGRTPR